MNFQSTSQGSFVPDPVGSSYNKVRKRYLKSKCNWPSESSMNWSPFRVAEKKYMSKFPPPDLSDVLDLALLDEERKDEVERGRWKGRIDAIDVRETVLKGNKGKNRRAFCVPQIPGLVILPGYIHQGMQRRLVRWSLAEHAKKPNQTNLDAHYKIPAEGIWNLYLRTDTMDLFRRETNSISKMDSAEPAESIPDALVGDITSSEISSRLTTQLTRTTRHNSATASELLPKLRWANIGWFYNWSTKQYEFDKGKPDVGEPVRSLCEEIVKSIDWGAVFDDELHTPDIADGANPEGESCDSSYAPDAGIVNFYQYKDTLMSHVDRSEICDTSPLVSLSLGNAAVFLIGGLTKDEAPAAILLRSGDAIVMAGPGCRRAYHGVPRILEGTAPAYFDEGMDPASDWALYSRYLRTTRINVNVRQVFPKGFRPSQSKQCHEHKNGDCVAS